MDRRSYCFGHFRVDAHSRVLWRDQDRVSVPPKTADVLIALLERGGELVTRDELMIVWPDTFVEDNNLAKHIFLLRKTLGDNEQGGAYIETVPKRGYRFAGRVEPGPQRAPSIEYEDHVREQIVIEETVVSPAGSRLWSRVPIAVVAVFCVCTGLFLWSRNNESQRWRSVLVLPFTIGSGSDPLLGSAFTQEIAARLRTIKSLRVVSPLSPVDAAEVSKRLSVDTILSGRLHFAETRVRAAAQLVSAHDGTVLWAEEAADLDGGDLNAVQSRLASAIAARLSGRLLPAERARIERRGSTNTEAYQAFMRGRAEMLRSSPDAGPKASRHFESASQLDPGFADAWAGLALAQQTEFANGSADRSRLAAATGNARRALSIDPDNIVARFALIRMYHSTGQNDDMLGEAKRVLEIDPADPDAQAAAALAYFRCAMLDRAIALYERHLAAYPDDQDAWFQLVHACLFARAFERGIRYAEPHISVQRLLFPTFLLYANSGDLARAVPLARQSSASSVPGSVTGYFSALVLQSAGLQAEARVAWTRAAERAETGLSRADNERNRMFLAMIYARLQEPRAARDHVRRALTVNPDDPWILFFASETYAILADRTAALDALRRSVGGGFLGLHYLDYYQQAPNGWYRYRQDPEFIRIRTGLARKIAELRVRY
jgi:DNA-binding winged helix-turn-helix (wHTH) protein/TolB-like protein